MGLSPDQFYRMSLNDIFIMVEAFESNEIAEMNRLRHSMWASLAAFGGKKTPTPQRLMPLPIDSQGSVKRVTKEEFIKLADKMAAIDKQKMAKA